MLPSVDLMRGSSPGPTQPLTEEQRQLLLDYPFLHALGCIGTSRISSSLLCVSISDGLTFCKLFCSKNAAAPQGVLLNLSQYQPQLLLHKALLTFDIFPNVLAAHLPSLLSSVSSSCLLLSVSFAFVSFIFSLSFCLSAASLLSSVSSPLSCCLFSVVSFLLSPFFCLLSSVSFLLSCVSFLLSPLFCLLSSVSCPLSLYLFPSLSVSLSLCLFMSLCLYLSVSLSLRLFISLSLYLSVSLSLCLSVSLSLCLFISLSL